MSNSLRGKKKILLVDDEQHIIDLIKFKLSREGFDLVDCNDGIPALEALKKSPFDLVILDILMPQMDGRELLREIRKTSNIPVIFLSSKSEEMDRIIGLELGADDYVTKPFNLDELAARVRAVLRRYDNNQKDLNGKAATIIMDKVEIDDSRYEVKFDGKEIKLTPGEYVVLRTLLEQPGIVFTRDMLLARLNKEDTYITERVIDTHVKNLRNIFRQYQSDFDKIETVHGIGYKWKSK